MDWQALPDENSYRFVAVLNKKIETRRLMNALGHMTAGLAGKVGAGSNLCFLDYVDQDGGGHPGISHFPFIILAADNSNKVRTVRNEAIARNLPFTDFVSSMTLGTSQNQVETTAATKEADLEYFGIVMFGETKVLKEFTNKFSLFK